MCQEMLHFWVLLRLALWCFKATGEFTSSNGQLEKSVVLHLHDQCVCVTVDNSPLFINRNEVTKMKFEGKTFHIYAYQQEVSTFVPLCRNYVIIFFLINVIFYGKNVVFYGKNDQLQSFMDRI